MPHGHPMGWDFSAMPDGCQPEGNESDGGEVWANYYSEKGSLPASERRSYGLNHYNVTPHRDTQLLPASTAPTGSMIPNVDEMATLRNLLCQISSVPYFLVSGSEETIFGYLIARLG